MQIFVAPAPITEPPVDLAKRCDPGNCELPYCFCSKDGTLIPGGLEAEDVISKTKNENNLEILCIYFLDTTNDSFDF